MERYSPASEDHFNVLAATCKPSSHSLICQHEIIFPHFHNPVIHSVIGSGMAPFIRCRKPILRNTISASGASTDRLSGAMRTKRQNSCIYINMSSYRDGRGRWGGMRSLFLHNCIYFADLSQTTDYRHTTLLPYRGTRKHGGWKKTARVTADIDAMFSFVYIASRKCS